MVSRPPAGRAASTSARSAARTRATVARRSLSRPHEALAGRASLVPAPACGTLVPRSPCTDSRPSPWRTHPRRHAADAVGQRQPRCSTAGAARARAATAPVTAPRPARPAATSRRARPCAGAVVADPPAVRLGVGAQPGVGVDRARVADQRRASAGRCWSRSRPSSGVRSRPSRSASVADRLGLGRAVQHLADEPRRCRRRRRARPRCPSAPVRPRRRAMMRGDLDRRGGDQPDPLALVEVQLGQRPGAGPDPVGHGLVEDLLADLPRARRRVWPAMKASAELAGLGDVLGVLDADEAEVGLLPGGRRRCRGW